MLLASQMHNREAVLGIAGIEAQVELVTPAALRKGAIDLLVLARFPGVLLTHSWPAPILILPPLPAVGPVVQRPIDVADLVDDGGVMRASVHYAGGIGRSDPIPDQDVAFVSAGRIATVITTRNGEGELAPGLAGESFGVFRVAERTASDPLAAIEQEITVIRPGSWPLLLFDSELADRDLAVLAGLGGQEAPEPLAVRMRPMRNCNSIRARLRAAGLPTRVADASAVLDEGAAFDVPEAVDPVRLARVGARMRAAGFAETSPTITRNGSNYYGTRSARSRAVGGGRLHAGGRDPDRDRQRRPVPGRVRSHWHDRQGQTGRPGRDQWRPVVATVLGVPGRRARRPFRWFPYFLAVRCQCATRSANFAAAASIRRWWSANRARSISSWSR